MSHKFIAMKFTPAGEIEKLPDGRFRFPAVGTVELNGIERRVMAGDEIAVQIGDGEGATLLINGIPAEEVSLDS